MKREHAYNLRKLLHKAAAGLSDEDALDGIELFPFWKVLTDYTRGIRVRYGDKLYRCEQTHTSQEGWEPDKTPALWTEVAQPGEIPVWRQPSGAQDAFRIGAKVWYPEKNTTVYISTLDYNTYPPDIYGWEVWTG